ncbi:MAG: type II toxin-antitoxin system HicA family toxin [Alphaproteobacteria bacterium]
MLPHHRKTLEDVFRDPPAHDIAWENIETMLHGCSAHVSHSDNNRMRLLMGGCVAIFHRREGAACIGRKTLKDLREFLIRAGVRR